MPFYSAARKRAGVCGPDRPRAYIDQLMLWTVAVIFGRGRSACGRWVTGVWVPSPPPSGLYLLPCSLHSRSLSRVLPVSFRLAPYRHLSLSLGFSLSRFLSLGFSLPRPRTPPPALPFGRTPIHQRQTSRRMSHRCRLRSRAAAPPGGARARVGPGAPPVSAPLKTLPHTAHAHAPAHTPGPRGTSRLTHRGPDRPVVHMPQNNPVNTRRPLVV